MPYATPCYAMKNLPFPVLVYCESIVLCSSGLYTASLHIIATFLKSLLHSTGSPLAFAKLISNKSVSISQLPRRQSGDNAVNLLP